MLQSSIERMQCEYIDLYQIHFPSRDTPLFGAHFFAPKGEARPFPFNDEGGYEMFEKQVRGVGCVLPARPSHAVGEKTTGDGEEIKARVALDFAPVRAFSLSLSHAASSVLARPPRCCPSRRCSTPG
jgi:hypothetical protein